MRTRSLCVRALLFAAALTVGPRPATLSGQNQTSVGVSMRLDVDASEAPMKILHATMSMPAKSGTMSLFYPKWIPGEHGPTGPITDLAGLKITAGDKSLAWRRDDIDMYAFHVEVPVGADALDVTLD